MATTSIISRVGSRRNPPKRNPQRLRRESPPPAVQAERSSAATKGWLNQTYLSRGAHADFVLPGIKPVQQRVVVRNNLLKTERAGVRCHVDRKSTRLNSSHANIS